jgi:HEAT repeat protein
MGLANSAYPHKLRELVPLLVDKEWQVRAGAIRAIGVVGTEAASLLLRFKMLSGDKDPEVMSECFTAVLALEGSDSVPLVAGFASGHSEVSEAAILALGASRRADAVAWLIAEFANRADPASRKCILLSLSTSRAEAAMEFLLDLIRTAGSSAASLAADALAIHSRDEALQDQVAAALRSRLPSPTGV